MAPLDKSWEVELKNGRKLKKERNDLKINNLVCVLFGERLLVCEY